MKVGLHTASFTWPGGPAALGRTLSEFARAAEESGITTLALMDHFFQIASIGEATEPMLEGYTGLGFLAACTSTVQLQLLCTGVTYRYPGILAKTMTTLDVLSGGRATFAVGAAWFDREHHGLGVPFPPLGERFEMLEECLQICLQMWGPDNGPYSGKHYQLAETLCVPAPISQPRPRIMIAGGGEKKTLRLVARYADECNLIGAPDAIAAKLEILRAHCETEGRDYATLNPTVLLVGEPFDDLDGFLSSAEQYAKLGVGTLFLLTRGPDPAAYARRVGEQIVPRLSELS